MRGWRSLLVAATVCVNGAAAAESRADQLPVPLTLDHVIRHANEHRAEVAAAIASAAALDARPTSVGSLEDPMISSGIDHYPFDTMEEDESGRRYDWSVTVEQRIPLSGVLGHRRRSALAEARRGLAEVERIRLDVGLQAREAFFMLRERRRMVGVLEQQRLLADELVASSTARYASGIGLQADVLRAEVETARVDSAQRVLRAETRAAEAMLNARMGRTPLADVPELAYEIPTIAPLPAPVLVETALSARPELRAGQSEIDRATADIDVMRSMYQPMAMVRVGRATTMAEGAGAMVMVGVSVPIWRARLAAGVAEAQAMQRMAAADLAAMRLMIEGDTAAARDEVMAALTRLDALQREIVPRTQMAVDASLAEYAAGRGTLVTVIEAVRSLWDARTEFVMAETAVAQATARLERTVGLGDHVKDVRP